MSYKGKGLPMDILQSVTGPVLFVFRIILLSYALGLSGKVLFNEKQK